MNKTITPTSIKPFVKQISCECSNYSYSFQEATTIYFTKASNNRAYRISYSLANYFYSNTNYNTQVLLREAHKTHQNICSVFTLATIEETCTNLFVQPGASGLTLPVDCSESAGPSAAALFPRFGTNGWTTATKSDSAATSPALSAADSLRV
jgi:hypothetical protein